MRRACSSIPANIAEGCGKSTDADFSRFLQIVFGSASEFEYHLILARDLGYFDDRRHLELDQKLIEVKKMLASLIKSIKTKS